VLPPRNRVYADRDTQAAFDAWNARAASIARMIAGSTLDTEALRAKIIAIRRGAVNMCDDLFMPKQHDPGGKVRITLKLDVKGKALFGGPGDCYRYRLSRTWDEKKPHAMFVMMNPSTADPLVDDPTVAKCGRFARAWGYGGVYVGNSFAYRATDKRHLRLVADPIGPDNDKHLVAMAKASHIVVFAYGQPGHRTLALRGKTVAQLLVKKAGITPHVLKLSKGGIPTHPLYLLESLVPVVWQL
jgi:hypothetical protein